MFTHRLLLTLSLCYTSAGFAAGATYIDVRDFLPKDFATGGSTSYMPQLQHALDAAGEARGTVIFPPATFLLDGAAGLRVSSNTTLSMRGTTFRLSPELTADGQAFLGENVTSVTFIGGCIRGERDTWSPGANIAGIRFVGACSAIRVYESRFENLSSNGIGLFATEDAPASDILVRDVVVDNCCNFYGDYLSATKGPAEGSVREDQGGVAFYHVDGWVVDGCTFRRSQSDGTHFYRSSNGRFVNNEVSQSQMGGYFLEGCRYVMAANNRIAANGSRGVTIERDSAYCTLSGNIVEHSGREGLWAPDVMAIVVSGNIFRENGRKDDTERDCEIRLDSGDAYETETRDIVITGNLFYTTAHQTAAILLTEDVRDVTLEANTFRGDVERETVVRVSKE